MTICVLPLSIAIVLVFSVFIFSPIFLSYFLFSLCCCLAVSTSAVDCLTGLVFETTYYLSRGTLNPIHSVVPITASIYYCCTPADQCPVCSVISVPVADQLSSTPHGITCTHQLKTVQIRQTTPTFQANKRRSDGHYRRNSEGSLKVHAFKKSC